MEGDMNERVALVTGGGSGIGQACVESFARRGAAVVVADRDEAAAQRVAAAVIAAGGRGVAFVLDVTDSVQCSTAVNFSVATFGGLHMAANVAGISGAQKPIHETTDEEWRDVLAVNLDGVFYSLRAEITYMVANGGGAIVNMGSIYSVVARDNFPAYIAAKHGLLGLSRSAALDYAVHGIRVNTVGPAVIRTALYEAHKDMAGAQERILATNPMQRVGESHEVGDLVTWLCSDQATFVTGGYYPVDGGYTAR